MRYILTLAASLSAPAFAAPPPTPGTPQEAAALARQLKTLVLQMLPDPLHLDEKKWNQQKAVRGKPRNDGRWIKVRVAAREPEKNLSLDVVDLVKEKAAKTFTIRLSFPVGIEMNRQTWANGVRLYSGSTRARLQVWMTMRCQLETRVDTSKGWLPDMIVRLRVLSSTFDYNGVTVEHTAGIGGDAAKVLGEGMIEIVKAFKPDLERKLKEKANATIVKAGNTKEIRVSLSDWLNGKAAPPAKK